MSMTGDHNGASGAASSGAPTPASPPLRRIGARAVIARWGRAIREVHAAVWVAGGTVVAVLLVVAATGGFTPASVNTPELGAGDEARTSTYAITVLGAEFTSEVESEYLEADPGEKILVLTTRMENLTDAPIGVGTTADRTQANLVSPTDPLLELGGVTPTGSPQVWRADGSAGQVVLQPGVPSEVTIAWTVPEEAFPVGAVSLDIHEAEVRRGAVILSSSAITWRAAELSARITVAAKGAR